MGFSRVWYFYRGGIPPETDIITGGVIPFILGVIRDGVVISCLIFFVHLGNFFSIYSQIIYNIFKIFNKLLKMLIPILLSIMMVNTEFFRYFGYHCNLNHFIFLNYWNHMQSSFFAMVDPLHMITEILIIPSIFLIACSKIRLQWVENFFKVHTSILIFFGILIAGILIQKIPQKTPLLTNLVENYSISFIKNLFQENEIKIVAKIPIEKILDTLPLESGLQKTPSWKFIDPEYPFIKATDHHLSKLGKLPLHLNKKDEDRDGFPLKKDCNDLNSAIHPGAYDIPRNGIDEDCSGCDADPPNIIFIHWEGLRAVNVDCIGYSTPSTPNFCQLAKQGTLFTNAYANGIQTRWSLISIYCSIFPRLSDEWIFKHNPDLNLLSFPEILRDRGYETIYAHGGNIGFANKLDRMSKWFETHYDINNYPMKDMEPFNWGIKDRDLFNAVYDLIKRRKDTRPFYMTIATISMHHPFTLPETKFEYENHKNVKNQLSNVARYSDDAMGNFIEKILNNKKWENTIFLISSDHGINWFFPHKEREQNILWEDLVWIPIGLIGKNWNIEPGSIKEIRQLADIGPTILDRLGIEVPNPFIGHSLLRRFKEREAKAFFATANGGKSAGLRVENHKYFSHFKTGISHLYNIQNDRKELNNLINDRDNKALIDEYQNLLFNVYSQNNALIKKNRIWNPNYWIDIAHSD